MGESNAKYLTRKLDELSKIKFKQGNEVYMSSPRENRRASGLLSSTFWVLLCFLFLGSSFFIPQKKIKIKLKIFSFRFAYKGQNKLKRKKNGS